MYALTGTVLGAKNHVVPALHEPSLRSLTPCSMNNASDRALSEYMVPPSCTDRCARSSQVVSTIARQVAWGASVGNVKDTSSWLALMIRRKLSSVTGSPRGPDS